MPAAGKLMDDKVLEAGELNKAVAIATSIKKRHETIATETDMIEVEKQQLAEISSKVFFEDLGGKFDEEGHLTVRDADEEVCVYGNHEYDTVKGRVTVNFKVPSSNAPKKVNGKEASEALTDMFGEEAFKTLFQQSKAVTVTADADTLKAQYQQHPGLFGLRIKDGVSGDALTKVFEQFPEVFELQVQDTEQYEKLFPTSTDTEKVLKVQNGFLEKLAKVDTPILMKARTFLLPFLQKVVKPAIVCGNTSKNKGTK